MVAILLVFGLKAASLVSCLRLRSAVCQAGEAALGDAPTATEILAAREEMLRVAREYGIDRPIVRSAVERRPESTGATTYEVVLELCARSCHAKVERQLTRRLTSDDLAALDREGIGEHTGDRWRHHHD